MSDDDRLDPLLPDEDQPEPPANDASSRRSLRKKQTAIEIADKESARFWEGIFADPVGRREIWRILHADLHAFNQTWAASPTGFPDPNAAWYERGKQDAGQIIHARLCGLDRAGVFLMHDEHDARFVKSKSAQDGRAS